MSLKCIPENAFVTLEFNKIREKLSAYCLGAVAAEFCLRITPETHAVRISKELECAAEAQRILEDGQTFLSHGYVHPEKILKELSVPGFVLDTEQIQHLAGILRLAAEARDYFAGENGGNYPQLTLIAGRIPDPSALIRAIEQILDEEGNVRPDASRSLLRISRGIQDAGHQCDLVFQKLVRNYAAKDCLADTLESVRNDRRVLAVKSEFKRQIRGILHDQSATGRTVLIEPEEVIQLNNDLFDLRTEYRAEIRRLLLKLCDVLRGRAGDLVVIGELVTELDLQLAKGHLGKALQASVPVIDSVPRLLMKRAFHPLLLLKNLGAGKETIPFDLELFGTNRLLLLSGPNAGGKSILMKAVGLLQLMVQSGIPVPVSSDSVFGIFEQISASLGDHQSIENDLSTYSSKLMEMRDCLAVAGDRSLVLIDEFGSGTDPRLGGAIAEGILESLCEKGVYGVITTHYSELKVYVYRKRGIVNGAMVFDKDRMTPTYELKIGKPGSSYTFEIAKSSGLPDAVLKYATRRTSGQNLKAMEDLLSDLEQRKKSLDQALRQAEQRSQQLDQLVQSYERMQNDLLAQRHRLRLEQKEQDYAKLSELNRELEQAVKEIKEQKNVDAAREKIREIRSHQSETRDEIGRIQKEIRAKFPKSNQEFQPGDFVRIHNSSQAGRIERIQKNVATVIMGSIRMDLPVTELVPAGEPLDIRTERSVRADTEMPAKFDPRIDLRGMRPGEASDILERFMDMAMIQGVHSVQIIHGKGTGALRKMVLAKLREYQVMNIEQPQDQQGGSGMTLVTL